MDAQPQSDRFAIGQSVSRKEDPVLLRGEGRYTDDISLAGQAYAVVVRSRYAHGVLRSVERAEAQGHAPACSRCMSPMTWPKPESTPCRQRPARTMMGRTRPARASRRWRPTKSAMSANPSPW